MWKRERRSLKLSATVSRQLSVRLRMGSAAAKMLTNTKLYDTSFDVINSEQQSWPTGRYTL